MKTLLSIYGFNVSALHEYDDVATIRKGNNNLQFTQNNKIVQN